MGISKSLLEIISNLKMKMNLVIIYKSNKFEGPENELKMTAEQMVFPFLYLL